MVYVMSPFVPLSKSVAETLVRMTPGLVSKKSSCRFPDGSIKVGQLSFSSATVICTVAVPDFCGKPLSEAIRVTLNFGVFKVSKSNTNEL